MADVIQSASCAEGTVEIEIDGAPISDSNPLPVDVVAGSISIDPGDIEIGAVEIKSATNDNRAEVDLPANLTSADLVLGTHDPSLPASLGTKTSAASTSVVIASDQAAVAVNDPGLADTVGQKTMAASAAVVIASDQSALTVGGAAADGAAVSGNPVRIAGKDGSGNTQDLLADTSGNLSVGGTVAAGAADSGNPVGIGGKAVTAQPAAATANNRVGTLMDLFGRVVTQNALRSTKSTQRTVITSSTAETTIVTADASNLLDLYGLVLSNTSSTVCAVDIRDATAGTIIDSFEVPANDTRGFVVPASDGIKQTTINNNWTATCGTSVASITVTAMFVKNSAA